MPNISSTAIGHLFEAEDESQEWPELHATIREARKTCQSNGAPLDLETLAGLTANRRQQA